ncbi:MAG: hypothetical protein WDM92_13205 [Caulobacteraceae bacterium]
MSTLVVIAAVLGFIAIAGVGLAFAGGGSRTATLKRARAISDRSRPEVRSRPSGPDPAVRRKQILKTLKEEERKQRKASVTLSARLNRAGLHISTRTFWIISGALALGIFGLFMLLRQTWWDRAPVRVQRRLGPAAVGDRLSGESGAPRSSSRPSPTPPTSSCAASSPAFRCTSA